MQKQFGKYSLSGAVGTTTHYLAMWVLVSSGCHPTAATGAGALLGGVVNYLLCRDLVFADELQPKTLQSSKHETSGELRRYIVVACVLGFLNTACFYLLFSVTNQVVVSQILSTAFVLPLGFVANKYWSFAQKLSFI